MDTSQPQDLTERGAGLAQYVKDLFQEFKNGRLPYEDKAEEHWLNFISQYQSSKTWRTKEGEGNRSRVFIKLTQQKCYTGHAKTMDALGPDVPFNLEPLKNIQYQIPAEQLKEIVEFRKRYISDYLKYIKFIDTLDNVVLSATIFPAAILKGPILVKERQHVIKERMIGGMPAQQFDASLPAHIVTEELVDKYIFEEVPFWDAYIDTNSKRSIGEIHYKRLLKQEFRELMDDPGYNTGQMILAIQDIDNLSSSYDNNDNDKNQKIMGEKYMGTEAIKDNRIPVIEYYGLVPVRLLREYGASVPENISEDEDVEACVALAGDRFVIKAEFNYYGYRPLMWLGVKKIPGSVYKNSIAGLIDDSQSMVNSAARMIIDNKALSGNGCVAVNSSKIDWIRTKNMEIYPRKTFFVKGDADVRSAIGSVNFQDVTLGLQQLFELFMRVADEESGIPKYSQGSDQQSYLNKTATGMSMIMSAANVNLKPFLKNIDDMVIEPVIERLDALFSMLGIYPAQFNVPLKVTATGTISLMAKELIVENLMKLLQITSNPQDDKLIRRADMIKEIAAKLGLDDFVKSKEEIQQIEQMLAQRQQQQPIQAKGEVDIDKLYPYLTRFEQMQVIASVGLQPDPNPPGPINQAQPAPQPAGMQQGGANGA